MSGSLEGADALRARFRAIGSTQPILRGLQIETVRRAKIKVPRKTGHLGRSIRPGSVDRGGAWVHARTPYAKAVEFGSGLYGPRRRKYEIKPKRGGFLAWPANAGGRRLSGRARTNAGPMVYARRVMHPGVKPRPFLIPAAKEAVQDGPMRDLVVGLWNGAA